MATTTNVERTAQVDADVSLDISDVEDVLGMIGTQCSECEAAYDHTAYLTRGSRGRRISTKVKGSCPECGYEHDVITGVEVTADFELGFDPLAAEEPTEAVR